MAAEDAKAPPSAHKLASRLNGFDGPTVWHEFTPLAKEHDAINLGQGFPDWEAPQFMKAAAKRAIDENYNQYTRSAGHIPLVEELAKWYTRVLQGDIDALSEVRAEKVSRSPTAAAALLFVSTHRFRRSL
jgi:kynurenine--oxoglutarate transaminase/cysteine-S-conjugate beta-lyase/glutamine--phenylpyruvate transaminase